MSDDGTTTPTESTESSAEAAAPTPAAVDAASAVSPDDASLLALIDRLSAMLDRTDLTELEVQVGGTGLVLRKPSALAPMVAAAVPVAGAAPTSADGPASPAMLPAADAGAAARPAVMAPLTGIWYASPAPGSAPYVNLGGEVAVGQVIGLIEAMKLFNEIKSDKAGRVAKINAESGKLVRAKQPLIEVDPL